LFVWATLPTGLDSKAMVPRSIAARVAYVPGTGFYADGTGHRHLRLNFSFPTPERIREGIRRLAGVVEQELAVRTVFGESAAELESPLPGAISWVHVGPGAQTPGPDLA
jgi:hypothetical protein